MITRWQVLVVETGEVVESKTLEGALDTIVDNFGIKKEKLLDNVCLYSIDKDGYTGCNLSINEQAVLVSEYIGLK